MLSLLAANFNVEAITLSGEIHGFQKLRCLILLYTYRQNKCIWVYAGADAFVGKGLSMMLSICGKNFIILHDLHMFWGCFFLLHTTLLHFNGHLFYFATASAAAVASVSKSISCELSNHFHVVPFHFVNFLHFIHSNDLMNMSFSLHTNCHSTCENKYILYRLKSQTHITLTLHISLPRFLAVTRHTHKHIRNANTHNLTRQLNCSSALTTEQMHKPRFPLRFTSLDLSWQFY